MHGARAAGFNDVHSGRWYFPLMSFLACAGYVVGWGLLFWLHNSARTADLTYMTFPGLLLLLVFLLGWVMIPVIAVQTFRKKYSWSYWGAVLVGLPILLTLWHVVVLRQIYTNQGASGTDEIILNGSFHSHVDIMLRVLVVWGVATLGFLLMAAVDGWHRYNNRCPG